LSTQKKKERKDFCEEEGQRRTVFKKRKKEGKKDFCEACIGMILVILIYNS
jgi:hypothetical protein